MTVEREVLTPPVRRSPVWRIVVTALIPVALLFGLIAWAFASPVGSSPDDDFHMGSIWCAQGDRAGLCESTPASDTKLVPTAVSKAAECYAFKPQASGNCVFRHPEALTPTMRGNFNGGGYPPLYYLTMSVFVGHDVSTSILAMRIVNAVLFVGIAAALYVLLSRRHRGIVLWGSLVAIVPFGMFIIPSVNPSSWATTSAATLWLALIGYYEAQTRGRVIGFTALALLCTLMGAGSRADAATFSVLAIIVVAVLKAQRTRQFALSSILPVALAVICVAFYFSSSQGNVINPSGGAPLSLREVLGLITTNLQQLPSLWTGALGQWGLGWLDTAMPAIVWAPAIVIASGVSFFGLRRSPLRKTIAVVLIGAALVFVPLYVLVHDRVLVGAGVQPRYIYPLMLLFTGLCLYGLHRLNLGMSRLQLLIVIGGLAVANAVALHTDIRRYVTGTKLGGANLDSGVRWWWDIAASPNAVWVAGSLAFAVALVAVGIVAWPRSNSAATQPNLVS